MPVIKLLMPLIKNKAALSFGLKIVGTLLNFAISITIARILGADSFGYYTFVLSIVAIAGLPIQVGLPTLILRELAKYRATGSWDKAKGIIKFSNCFVLMIWGAFAGIATLWMLSTRGGEFIYLNSQKIWIIAVCLTFTVALGRLRESMLQASGKVILAQFGEKLINPAILLILIYTFSQLGKIDSADVLSFNLTAAMAALIMNGYLVIRDYSFKTRLLTPKYELKNWVTSMLPLGLLAGLNLINNQTDIVMLGLLSSSKEVAEYKVAFSFSALIIFAMSAIEAVIAPVIVRLYTLGKLDLLQIELTNAAQYSLISAILISAIFLVFGKSIINLLYGQEYAGSYYILVILSIGQIVNAATGSVHAALNLTGHERDTLKISVAAAAVNIVGNLILIGKFGGIGAALATTLSMIYLNVKLAVVLKSRTGMWTVPFLVAASSNK